MASKNKAVKIADVIPVEAFTQDLKDRSEYVRERAAEVLETLIEALKNIKQRCS